MRRLWTLVLTVAVAALFLPKASDAQITQCQTGCNPTTSVDVTPDGGTATAVSGSSGNIVTFIVQNTGTTSGTWTLTCSSSKPMWLTCGTVTPSSLTIAAGISREVDVEFTSVMGPGATITLTATGTATDQGTIAVTFVTPAAPTVALRNGNGDNLDRGLCLTAGAGEAAASQCGDLLVAHGTPSYATMGRERSATLLYSSAQAVPRPEVVATVTEPAGIAPPTTVFVELKLNLGAGYVTMASATYYGWGSILPSRQIAIAYTDTTNATGLYPFQLTVQNQYASGNFATVVTGNLFLVNRTASAFGRGWSMAGKEEIRFNQPVSTATGDILWLGGDGSARRYGKVNATTWVAPAGAFRDTLLYNGTAKTYTRTLRHGVQVVFDTLGRHAQTVSRTGQRTRFYYSGVTTQLDSIRVPPVSVAGTRYKFVYASGKLDYLDDPAARRLEVTVSAAGRLTAIADPDTSITTQFGYDAEGRMTSRTSRRGYVTSYAYANGLRLTKVIVPGTLAAGDTTVFQPWDEKGLATGPTGQTAVDTALAYTKILGARVGVADDATFWIDRWGAPVKTQNPLGQVTTLVRGDGANPALITKVTSTDGRIGLMSYNSRGNLTETRDSSLHLANGQPTAVNKWFYNSLNTKDSPDSIVDPEGIFSKYRYNNWGLDSLAIAPNGHVTRFEYKAAGSADSLYGLVRAVTELSVPAWDSATNAETTLASPAIKFGFNALGNVVADTSPMGRVRTYTRDTRQLVITAFDPGGYRTDFGYDNLNRTTRQVIHGELAGISALFPADSGVSTPDTTKWTYSLDVLTQVRDPRGVTRGYGYDRLGRRITETDDYGVVDSTWYNAAGAADSVSDRTRHKVRSTYDAGGRLNKTRWEARLIDPADSVVYAYDAGNRVLTAQRFNPGRTTARTYYGSGLLKTEWQSGLANFRNTYTYDKAGKRLSYLIGPSGNVQFNDSIAYRYNATTGDLARIFVRWRHPAGNTDQTTKDSVRFAWDALGRRDTVAFPIPSLLVRFAYDADGQPRVVCGVHTPRNPTPTDYAFHNDMFNQWVDANGRVLKTTRIISGSMCGSAPFTGENFTNTYDVKGQLLSQIEASGWKFRYDRSGNLIRRNKTTGTDNNVFTIAAGHNRLDRHDRNASVWSVIAYDPDGSRAQECPIVPNPSCSVSPGYRDYYYDGLGRTSGTYDYACTGFTNDWFCRGSEVSAGSQNCGYDAMGRLDHPCESTGLALGYDGQKVSRTTNDSSHTGWTFVHGPGVDDPVLAYSPFGSTHANAYFITDGNGRQLAVGDSIGVSFLGGGASTKQTQYQGSGGWYSGAARTATTFGADRFNGAVHSGLTNFRNRFYDQTTGRWTQEDPIGLAGGINLYQFNGNNPVAYTDPFGLCPPKDFTTPCSGQDLIDQVAGRVHGLHAAVIVGLTVELGGPFAAATGLQLAGAASAAGTAAAPLGAGTLKLVAALEDAGPSLGARINAASRWAGEITKARPSGGTMKIVVTELAEGIFKISGRGREIFLHPTGVSVIRGAVDGVWKTIATIQP